jgi:hypothetical protein
VLLRATLRRATEGAIQVDARPVAAPPKPRPMMRGSTAFSRPRGSFDAAPDRRRHLFHWSKPSAGSGASVLGCSRVAEERSASS